MFLGSKLFQPMQCFVPRLVSLEILYQNNI